MSVFNAVERLTVRDFEGLSRVVRWDFGSWCTGCKLGALLQFFQGYPVCLLRFYTQSKVGLQSFRAFPFLSTFPYRVLWSTPLSFVCPTFKIASGDCIIMFVLPMYNIMLTNQSIVLVYPRPIKVIGTFLFCFIFYSCLTSICNRMVMTDLLPVMMCVIFYSTSGVSPPYDILL